MCRLRPRRSLPPCRILVGRAAFLIAFVGFLACAPKEGTPQIAVEPFPEQRICYLCYDARRWDAAPCPPDVERERVGRRNAISWAGGRRRRSPCGGGRPARGVVRAHAEAARGLPLAFCRLEHAAGHSRTARLGALLVTRRRGRSPLFGGRGSSRTEAHAPALSRALPSVRRELGGSARRSSAR